MSDFSTIALKKRLHFRLLHQFTLRCWYISDSASQSKGHNQKNKAWSLSEKEHRKLKRLYTQRGAVYGSVQNLVKASKLPVSKFKQFLAVKTFL